MEGKSIPFTNGEAERPRECPDLKLENLETNGVSKLIGTLYFYKHIMIKISLQWKNLGNSNCTGVLIEGQKAVTCEIFSKQLILYQLTFKKSDLYN